MGRRPLKTFTRTISHFIIISRTTVIVARLVNTMDNEQQQGPPPLPEPVAACPVVPSKHAVTDKVNRLLILSRVYPRRSPTFMCW